MQCRTFCTLAESCRDEDFFGIQAGGTSMADALEHWLSGATTVVFDPSKLGENPSCWQPGPTAPHGHGNC